MAYKPVRRERKHFEDVLSDPEARKIYEDTKKEIDLVIAKRAKRKLKTSEVSATTKSRKKIK